MNIAVKDMHEDTLTRCGIVALMGAPNAGKSTLTNALVGEKISIVTPKVQTTRQRITGIAMHDQTQLVLFDTPGLFEPKVRMERAMVEAAFDAGRDADVRLFLIDASYPLWAEPGKGSVEASEKLLNLLGNLPQPFSIVLNKIDKAKPEILMKNAAFLNESAVASRIDRVFMISALQSDGTKDLMHYLCDKMPVSPFLYPEDHLSDMPERLLAAEITREQVILQLYQELPYATYVETEGFETFRNGDVKISQQIIVAKESQKAIVLGHKGGRIKAIREAAQKQLSYVLDRKIHLFLHVKVIEDWQEKGDFYGLTGLNYKA